MNHIIRRQLVPKLSRHFATKVNTTKKEISDVEKITSAINNHSDELCRSLSYIEVSIFGVQLMLLIKYLKI